MSELEHKLKTILKATLESPDSELRLNVTSEIGKVKEELQRLKLSNLKAMSKLSMKAPDYHFYHGQNSLINKLDS